MIMEKLIGMTDFVLEQGNPSNTDSQFADKIMAYANFLKQPLELWMFVPCKLVNDVWVVLEGPLLSVDFWEKGDISKELQEYQQAKERCLFCIQHGNEEMFDQCLAKVFLDEFFNIEQLANEIRNIKLTPAAQKQIG